MKPTLIEYDVGKDFYGRSVKLRRRGEKFEIEIEPSSQRDEGERMFSLTAANLQQIAEAVNRQP